MTKWEYYKKYINNLINTDFLEGACSEETSNEYKKAIEYLLEEIEEYRKENWKLNDENLKYRLFFKDLKELMEVDNE